MVTGTAEQTFVPARASSVPHWLTAAAGPATAAVATLAIVGFGTDTPNMWPDEAATVTAVQRPWEGLWQLSSGADAPLVPYYMLAKLWLFMWPAANVIDALRWMSVAAAAVTVAAVFRYTQRNAGLVPAVAATAILAALPGFARYGQEARPYSLLCMLAALSWMLAAESWRTPRRSNQAAAAVALAGTAVLHTFGILQWFAMIGASFTGGSRLRRRQRVPQQLAVTGAAALLAAAQIVNAALHGTGPAKQTPLDGPRLWSNLSETIMSQQAGWGAVPLLILAVIGAVVGFRSLRCRTVVTDAMWWLLIPLVGMTVLAAAKPNLLRPRYWQPLNLPIAILAGVAIASAATPAAAKLAARLAGTITVAAVACHLAAAISPNAAVRSVDGHGQNYTALTTTAACRKLATDRNQPVAAYPATTATLLSAANMVSSPGILFQANPNSAVVWLQQRSPAQVDDAVKGSNRMLLISPPSTGVPKILQQAGFAEYDQARCGTLRVRLLQRLP